MNRKDAKLHPGPWKRETWLTSTDGPRYRVIDALNNPIGYTSKDREEIQSFVDARNEELSPQVLEILKIHRQEINILNQEHQESHSRSRKEIDRLEKLLRVCNFPSSESEK